MTRYFAIIVLVLATATPGILMAGDPDQEAAPDLTPVGGLSFKDEIALTIVNVIAYVTERAVTR